MIRAIFCYFLLIFSSIAVAHSPKTLVLIIASDDLPVYREFTQSWKKYMHSDPAHFTVYFLRADKTLNVPTLVDGDTIWIRTEDGLPPQSGSIITKTVLALHAMRDVLHQYDYVLRTNLSSFYVFPRLLQHLKKLPRKKCYSGSPIYAGEKILSGSGFILSRDLAELLVRKKELFIGQAREYDDVLIGRYILAKKIRWVPHERMNFTEMANIEGLLKNIPEHIFQFRVKHNPEDRLIYDIYVHQRLYNLFYR